MSYQFSFTYSKSLLREAVLRFWWHVLGWRFFIALGMVLWSFISLLIQGDTSWIFGVNACVLVLGIAFMTLLYSIHYRNMMSKFREMGSSQATFTASESTFTLSSEIGNTTLQWSAVTEIWPFPKFWLLFFSKAQFVTLPLIDLPLEVRDFILQKVKAAGGRIG